MLSGIAIVNRLLTDLMLLTMLSQALKEVLAHMPWALKTTEPELAARHRATGTEVVSEECSTVVLEDTKDVRHTTPSMQQVAVVI